MKTLAGKTMWTVAVMAVLGVTTSVAQAGHYDHIDDHARDIERSADRAQRDIRHDFARLPHDLRQCLMSNLYQLEKNAECIDDLTRRPGNLNEIARHVDEMFGQLAEVEAHVDELRTWCRSCVVTSRHRSSCGTMSRDHERALRDLIERTSRIRRELDCLADELRRLMPSRCEVGHHHGDRGFSRRPTIVVPPVVPRPPVIQPSSRFGTGFSRHGSVWNRYDDWRGFGLSTHGSRLERSHGAINIPLSRRGGSSFGLSLSFR